MPALQTHIDAVKKHSLLGHDIDFKLAASPGPRSPQAAQESGFTSLSVTLCKVLPCLPDLMLTFMCLVSATA